MASFKKMQSGKWQAQVAKAGVRRAKSFSTKAAAKDWANRQEYRITEGDQSAANLVFRDLLQRYAREVSPEKRGARWEYVRLDLLSRDKIADISLRQLSAADFADWRDRRLLEVKPASVNREMVLMSAVLSNARREWGLIAANPLSDVRKPSKPPPRDRRVSVEEIEQLLAISGSDLTKLPARAIHAFLFAVETAMRAGEILGLVWDRVDTEKRVAKLDMTKNGTTREVPLSRHAIELLDKLNQNGASCFEIKSSQLDVHFRNVRDKAKIKNLRFHDSRHEAITRLSRKLSILPLARMVGHRDIKMLQVYYNETAEEIALLLD